MIRLKNILLIILCSFSSAAVAVFIMNNYYFDKSDVVSVKEYFPIEKVSLPFSSASINNFTSAASVATPAVVHIKTQYVVDNSVSRQFYGDDVFEWFFGQHQKERPRFSRASGSGVIVSRNGYIVTNNHVVEDANLIEVTLNNNVTYQADLVGRDKDTDIAVLKISEENLPFLSYANSDEVLVGEWVLAVGNPFNLSSTVTAGIVSAKARSINILENIQGQSNTAIESFIQTDAAVNPGNSGGALVNTKGELIGVNTAIATPTGTFAGYSFAVPSNLVEKVVNDIIEFGAVQRGYLGVSIITLDNSISKEFGLETNNGVYLQSVAKSGAAYIAGLRAGDVITEIDREEVVSVPELQQKIAEFRPGDKINIKYFRNNETFETELMLISLEDMNQEIQSLR